MARRNRVTLELIFLTSLCAIVTLITFMAGHERRWLLLLLTCGMALLMGVAQFRSHREVRTIKGARGRRRKKIEA